MDETEDRTRPKGEDWAKPENEDDALPWKADDRGLKPCDFCEGSLQEAREQKAGREWKTRGLGETSRMNVIDTRARRRKPNFLARPLKEARPG